MGRMGEKAGTRRRGVLIGAGSTELIMPRLQSPTLSQRTRKSGAPSSVALQRWASHQAEGRRFAECARDGAPNVVVCERDQKPGPPARLNSDVNLRCSRIYPGRVARLFVFSFPVPERWVPRPCVLCKGGPDAACTTGLSCPAACIGPTALITCTLSLPRATGDCPCGAPRAAAKSSFRFRNRRTSCAAAGVRGTRPS
jgi:hypothetical protein